MEKLKTDLIYAARRLPDSSQKMGEVPLILNRYADLQLKKTASQNMRRINVVEETVFCWFSDTDNLGNGTCTFGINEGQDVRRGAVGFVLNYAESPT